MSISKEAENSMEGSLMGEMDEGEAGPSVGGVDHARIESAVREILFAVGENPDREGLVETPARVARRTHLRVVGNSSFVQVRPSLG